LASLLLCRQCLALRLQHLSPRSKRLIACSQQLLR
jgi:hypothetical protein